jgi:hypothetical protein
MTKTPSTTETIDAPKVAENADAPVLDETKPAAPAVPAKPAPNATVTAAQLADACKAGKWTHDDPNTTLWLNSAFVPNGRTPDEMTAVLAVHGVAVA